jgi:hypothetical protein
MKGRQKNFIQSDTFGEKKNSHKIVNIGNREQFAVNALEQKYGRKYRGRTKGLKG